MGETGYNRDDTYPLSTVRTASTTRTPGLLQRGLLDVLVPRYGVHLRTGKP